MKHPHEGMKTVAATLHPTLNDLPEKTRKKVVKLLNEHVADGLDLRTHVKQAHWNEKGPNFFGLHRLFDKVASSLDESIDAMAERAVELGGIVHGTVRVAAAESRLPEYPLEIVAARDHVKAVAGSLAKFGKFVRESIEETAPLDADTADLLTQISRDVDKWLWMVEAHQG